MSMTPEQAEDYKRLLQLCDAQIITNVNIPELDKLATLPQWKTLLFQLDRDDIRAVKSYLQSEPHWGFTEPQIQRMERATQRLKQVLLSELCVRWVVWNRETRLYWATMTEKPYWRTRRTAFLMTEKEAISWANRFCKASKTFDYEPVKIDATKRLMRCKLFRASLTEYQQRLGIDLS